MTNAQHISQNHDLKSLCDILTLYDIEILQTLDEIKHVHVLEGGEVEIEFCGGDIARSVPANSPYTERFGPCYQFVSKL